MSRRNLTASIRLTASAGPLLAPPRFRIWRAGANPGDYGELNFTPRAADSVMAEYQRRGNALVMDIEHALNRLVNPAFDPAKPPPTAGYLALELVDGDLWGVPRWSDCGRPAPVPGEVCCGKHQIESGQRCYVSPDWQIDTDSMEPRILNRVSLVAEPATFGINLLASRAASGGTMADEMGTMRAGYAAAKAMMASEEKAVAKAASTLCGAYETAAATLGIKLGAEGGGEEKAPAEGGGGQATAGDQTQTTTENKDMADEKSKDAAAAATTAALTAARVQSPRALTIDDVRVEWRLQEERGRLAGVVASRLPPGQENFVASMSIAQLREAARTLPVPKPDDAGTGGDAGGNVTAGKTGATAAVALNEEEKWRLKRWARGLEVKEDNMVAARAAWAADPVGGEIEVDPFKHLLRGTTGRGAVAVAAK